MKKISFLLIALFSLLGASQASAQKIGYISVDEIVSLMPELGRVDTLLQKYQMDSLATRYQYYLGEFQRKDSMVNGADSVKNYPNAGVRAQVREELQQLAGTLQNWQSLAGQAYENKKNSLLEPVLRKVYAAINVVAKENNYTYVLSKENLIVAPQGDDMILLVARKLNIKLPQGAGNPAAPATGGAAPKPKAGGKQ
ncbi:MAG: OmpH family outer membrane protein [Chitinophagaceae bacterium]|nr:MAG: OmpH family outer membrane protein [Chitinophagaceae bacterium]